MKKSTELEIKYMSALKEKENAWPNVLARQRKFAKPELACGLAMGGQTSCGSQVRATRKIRKFHAYTVDLRSSCVDLRWVKR